MSPILLSPFSCLNFMVAVAAVVALLVSFLLSKKRRIQMSLFRDLL